MKVTISGSIQKDKEGKKEIYLRGALTTPEGKKLFASGSNEKEVMTLLKAEYELHRKLNAVKASYPQTVEVDW